MVTEKGVALSMTVLPCSSQWGLQVASLPPALLSHELLITGVPGKALARLASGARRCGPWVLVYPPHPCSASSPQAGLLWGPRLVPPGVWPNLVWLPRPWKPSQHTASMPTAQMPSA